MSEVLIKVFLIIAAFTIGLCLGPEIAEIEKKEKIIKYFKERKWNKKEEDK